MLLLSSLFLVFATVFAAQTPASLTVINYSGFPLEVFWKDANPPFSLVKQLDSPLRNSTEAKINSFETHKFVVRIMKNGVPLEASLVKGQEDEAFVVTYNSSSDKLEIELQDRFQSWVDQLKGIETVCHGLVGDSLVDCVSRVLKSDVDHLTASLTTLHKTTTTLSHRLRNYTCADESLETSTPLYSLDYSRDGKKHEVQVLFNHSHAKIWLVDDFISDEECAILERVGRPKLYRATVAAEDGTSIVSENRKAQQASYDSHQRLKEKDPLWGLQQRILAITNHYTGLNLTHPGQESFTIIQYNPSDQYTPHCDGTCDFTPHNKHGRVATAVMYCLDPIRGGATTFTKTNLLVRPKKGAVTFFAYKGADGRMDPGFTEHSGCPVLEGEKLIATFWMRDGVTAEEPSTLYDPMGLRIYDPNAPDQQ